MVSRRARGRSPLRQGLGRTSAGHPAVTYTRGLDLSGSLAGAGGIGGLLARTAHQSTSPYQPSTHACYHADGNGNVTYLLRQDRTHGASYRYDPYGRLIASSGGLATANTLRFSSKEWHASAGLYYYGYRFYLPEAQRWVNRDPINELGFNLLIRSQNPFNWDEEKNLYGFVHNDPMNLVDGDGRVPVVAIFFYGNAIGNIGIACYSCKKLNDCLETAKDYTKRAGEGMDPEKFQEWLRAAKPGSECTGLMKDCGVRVIQATFWVAGRLLILKYLAK